MGRENAGELVSGRTQLTPDLGLDETTNLSTTHGSTSSFPYPLPTSSHPLIVNRKVAFLGFRAVGKSAIVNYFVNGSFTEA
jgi:hypothetical protein